MRNAAPFAKKPEQGFTLIELMVVVAIIGVLAAVAVPAFSSYIYKSRAAEAVNFLAEIRQRQESYRAEFGQYCAVSGADWGTYTPAAVDASNPVPWPAADANWQQLGAIPPGPVRFQYATIAGPPGTVPPGASGTGYTGDDFWFVAQARGDLDGDAGGNLGDATSAITFEVYSASNHVWSSQSKGWE